MAARWIDHLVLGGALLAAIVSAVCWAGQSGFDRSPPAQVIERPGEKPWTVPEEANATVPAARWTEPTAQPRGPGWRYDLFTPPEIFYDGPSGQFSVVRPAPAAAPAAVEAAGAASFGLEVRAVQRPLFRLQLVGYVGGEGGDRGLFENVETGETFLASGERPVPALNVRIETFEVVRLPVDLPESMTTLRSVARANVHDERTGEAVMLTSLERCYTAAPTAVVAGREAADGSREVHEGDTVAVGGATFTIDRIQLAPPRLEVTKATSDGTATERRTLALADTPAGQNL